jgi:hypothetical protein
VGLDRREDAGDGDGDGDGDGGERQEHFCATLEGGEGRVSKCMWRADEVNRVK